jgi:hypothetical protein
MFELSKEKAPFIAAALGLFLLPGSIAAQSAKAQPRPPEPKKGPEVTGVQVRPLKTRVTPITCPADFSILGEITTNGATTVKYTWVTSDGKSWPDKTLKFTALGVQGVTLNWKPGKPGKKNVKAWVQLKIIDPNPMISTKMSFEFHCK